MSDKDLSKPVAWTNEEELRDVRRVGFGEMFYADTFVCAAKNVDLNRVIPIYSDEYVQSLLRRIALLEQSHGRVSHACDEPD